MTKNDLGEILRQRRVMIPLTLGEVAARSGVSASHLGRIERGQRFPSARILRKIAKPLDFSEAELFGYAGYWSPQPSTESEAHTRRLDPDVVKVLSEEPVHIQRTVIGILNILKSMDVEFAEYVHRKYPEVDKDIITMVKDILEHPPKKGV